MPMQYTTYSSEKMKVSNYIENVEGKNQTYQVGIVDFSIKKTKRDIDIIGYAQDRPNKLQIISKILFHHLFIWDYLNYSILVEKGL